MPLVLLLISGSKSLVHIIPNLDSEWLNFTFSVKMLKEYNNDFSFVLIIGLNALMFCL